MKIMIINGPNLNLLGIREKGIYGSLSFEEFFQQLKSEHPEMEMKYYQSNVEGELINKLHETGFDHDGIILNAGGYTHTSVALSDAVAAITTPVIEVHISNIYAREEYRHTNLLSKNCQGLIAGFGLAGYAMALNHLETQKSA